jgi:hypothetical protein
MFFLMECEDEDSLGWMVKATSVPRSLPIIWSGVNRFLPIFLTLT